VSGRYRERLVARLRRSGAIRSSAVRDAFLRVPREVFIPDVAAREGIEAVYRDEPFPTKLDEAGNAISSSSQPAIMAMMLEELRVSPGHRVLEIGAGTGYNAALLSALVGRRGRVTSIELEPDVAGLARRAVGEARERANVVTGDGRSGWAPDAPYDRIIVTASGLDVPRAFQDQLREGGLLVIPLRLSDAVPFRQIVVTFERKGEHLRSVSVIHGGFMRLRGHPNDPSLPWPVSEIAETTDGDRVVRASLSGSTWGALSHEDRRRLLALLLSAPRRRPIGVRASGAVQWGLEAFVALAVPEERLVGCTRAELAHLLYFSTALPAVIEVGPRPSLAHLSGTRTLSRIDAYGARGAEAVLRRAVEDWIGLGRPGVGRLQIEVSYGRHARGVWRTRRRGSSLLAFDWVASTRRRQRHGQARE
jgi:protein-L-isoaspartate(D-aspartate) O-methyltransferase